MFENRKIKNYITILGMLPFVILPCFLAIKSWGETFDKYEPTLISIEVTIAIFAVNFSFLVYQFSPYKALLGAISRKHTVASIFVLTVAAMSLIVLVINKAWVPMIALASIPIVLYSSIGLSWIAKRETDPLILMEGISSKNNIQKFLAEFGKDIQEHLDQFEKMELSSSKDTPMFEWGHRVVPHVRLFDPFNTLVSIGHISIQNSDIHTFSNTVNRILEVAKVVEKWKVEDEVVAGYKVKSVLANHVTNTINRVAVASYELDKSDTMSIKFLEVCDLFFRKQALEGEQTSELSRDVMGVMVKLAVHLLKKGNRDSAIIPLVLARQAAQRGLDNPANKNPHFDLSLPYLVDVIKVLGNEAITHENTEYLYRCTEALGWLGCSAVKKNDREMGLACIQACVQLGRFARSKKLVCFWDRCALEPVDHAEESINWMLSWVGKLEPESVGKWVGTFEEAYSRLRGITHKLLVETGADNKQRFRLESQNKPHKTGYSTNSFYKTIDYSDVDFLKEYRLY